MKEAQCASLPVIASERQIAERSNLVGNASSGLLRSARNDGSAAFILHFQFSIIHSRNARPCPSLRAAD
jgi:hypothetical protein